MWKFITDADNDVAEVLKHKHNTCQLDQLLEQVGRLCKIK